MALLVLRFQLLHLLILQKVSISNIFSIFKLKKEKEKENLFKQKFISRNAQTPPVYTLCVSLT